jgi:hypothetical protein
MPTIPTVLEAEIRRVMVQGQPGQKVNKTSSQPISQAWKCIPVIPTTQEATSRKITVGG